MKNKKHEEEEEEPTAFVRCRGLVPEAKVGRRARNPQGHSARCRHSPIGQESRACQRDRHQDNTVRSAAENPRDTCLLTETQLPRNSTYRTSSKGSGGYCRGTATHNWLGKSRIRKIKHQHQPMLVILAAGFDVCVAERAQEPFDEPNHEARKYLKT